MLLFSLVRSLLPSVTHTICSFFFGIIQFVAVFHLSVYYPFLIIGGDEQVISGRRCCCCSAGFLRRFVRIVEEKKTLFYFYQYPQQDSVSHIGVEYNEQEYEEEDLRVFMLVFLLYIFNISLAVFSHENRRTLSNPYAVQTDRIPHFF